MIEAQGRGRQRGFALLLVLWTILLLALLAAATIDSSRTDINLTRNLVEAIRAELQAESAANVAIYAVINSATGEQAWKTDGSIDAGRG